MADTGYRLPARTLSRIAGRMDDRALWRLVTAAGTPDDLRLAAAVLDAGGFTEDAERVRAMEGR